MAANRDYRMSQHERSAEELAVELSAGILNMATRLKRAEAALHDIIFPVDHMRREAAAQGKTLNGMAYNIALSSNYLQSIARKALEENKDD